MTEWILYQHTDGRSRVSQSNAFTAGDPGWHRCYPVEAPEMDVLRDYALDKISHRNRGDCADEFNTDARDPLCPVCRALGDEQ